MASRPSSTRSTITCATSWRHAEADLEAAVGDVMPRPARPCAQNRRAGFGARAHPGPAVDHLVPRPAPASAATALASSASSWASVLVGSSTGVPRLTRWPPCRRHAARCAGHRRKSAARFRRSWRSGQRLPFTPSPTGRPRSADRSRSPASPVAQTTGPSFVGLAFDHLAPRARIAATSAAAAMRGCRRALRLSWTSQPEAEAGSQCRARGRHHLPCRPGPATGARQFRRACAPVPPPPHRPRVADGPCGHSRMRRPEAAATARPPVLRHQQALQLKRLLFVPVFRHMRRKRADHAARRSGPDALRLDQRARARRAAPPAHAIDRPKMPPPRTVRSTLAILPHLPHGPPRSRASDT